MPGSAAFLKKTAAAKSCREREKMLRTVSEFNRSGAEPIRNKSYAQNPIILPLNNGDRNRSIGRSWVQVA